MKILLNALLIACAPLALGQTGDAGMPPALAAARARFNLAVAADVKNYMQALARLKADASQPAGDPALAAAVTKEMASLSASGLPGVGLAARQHTLKSGTSTGNDSSLSGLEASLENTTWVWVNAETFTFLPNGKAQWNIINVPTMSWKVVSNSPPVIVGIAHSGNKYKMTLDPDLQSGTIDEEFSPERITARLPAK